MKSIDWPDLWFRQTRNRPFDIAVIGPCAVQSVDAIIRAVNVWLQVLHVATATERSHHLNVSWACVRLVLHTCEPQAQMNCKLNKINKLFAIRMKIRTNPEHVVVPKRTHKHAVDGNYENELNRKTKMPNRPTARRFHIHKIFRPNRVAPFHFYFNSFFDFSILFLFVSNLPQICGVHNWQMRCMWSTRVCNPFSIAVVSEMNATAANAVAICCRCCCYRGNTIGDVQKHISTDRVAYYHNCPTLVSNRFHSTQR